MLRTEPEAKRCWCPFARVVTAHGYDECGGWHTSNRMENGAIPHNSNCLGSECMAWRWESTEAFGARQEAYEDSFSIAGIDDHGPEPVRRGYCGLAGKPEE